MYLSNTLNFEFNAISVAFLPLKTHLFLKELNASITSKYRMFGSQIMSLVTPQTVEKYSTAYNKLPPVHIGPSKICAAKLKFM